MNKSTALIVLVVFYVVTLPVFFITIPIGIWMYNNLVKRKNYVDLGFSGIDVMLKKRFDLIPNVVASVKEYMVHERELLSRITALRSGISQTSDQSDERFKMEGELSQLLGNISVAVEAYPELKSQQNVIMLQRTLNELEEQISASRRSYNAAVLTFNNSIETFPSIIFAALMEYELKPFFETQAQERVNPNVAKLFS